MIRHYIDHQVGRDHPRTRYELRKAEERDHIVQGLLIALANIDEVIAIIRGSDDTEDARTNLMGRFELSEIQANHILDMPLRRLTRLSREELEDEHKELLARIEHLNAAARGPGQAPRPWSRRSCWRSARSTPTRAGPRSGPTRATSIWRT